MVAIPLADPVSLSDQAADSVAPSFTADQPAFSIFPAAGGENAEQPAAAESEQPAARLPEGELLPPHNLPPAAEGIVAEPVATAEPVAVAEPVDPAELAANREAKYQERLHDAEQDYLEACCERDRIESEIGGLKSALKDAKEHAETCYGRLIDVRNKTPQQMELDLAGDAAGKQDDDEAESAEPSDSAAAESPVEATTDPDQWRAASIAEIDLEGIEGLGPKKIAKLIEAVPTVGDLEDLRVKAAAAMPPEPLNTFLPKGIGKQSAEIITDRLLVWLSKTRDKEAFGDLPTVNDAESTEAAGECLPAEVEELPENHESQVLARARELSALAEKPAVGYGAIFEDGQRAAENDWPLTDCNWTAGDKQDSWLLGWLDRKGPLA